MPTHPCKQADHAQLVEEIRKEGDEPRQSASVKAAFEKKKNPAPVAPETLAGNKGGKTRAAKSRVSR